MKKFTTKEMAKINKALKAIKEAEMLIQSVIDSNDKFKYDGNTTALQSRVSGSASILEQHKNLYDNCCGAALTKNCTNVYCPLV